jgi:hypothetical protein
LIYLASPYSNADPAVEQARFDAVCRAAAALMRQGLLVFSPIAHSHPIARFGLPTDWSFWQRYDSAFLAQCDELWVLMLPGWDRSVGVRAEVRLAKEMGKPMRLVEPVELTTENTPAITGASHAGAVAAGLPLQGELAALGLGESAAVAFGFDLTRNGRVEGIRRRLAVSRHPQSTGDRQVHDVFASHRIAGAERKQVSRRVQQTHRLGLTFGPRGVTFARVAFGCVGGILRRILGLRRHGGRVVEALPQSLGALDSDGLAGLDRHAYVQLHISRFMWSSS